MADPAPHQPVFPELFPRRPAMAGRPAPLLLRELRPAGCAEVAFWPQRAAEGTAALRDWSGMELPPASGLFRIGGACLLAATAPGRFLVLADGVDPVPGLRDCLPAELGAVVDLGHSRCGIRLAGPPAAAVLLKGLDLDLDPAASPVGRVAQSVVHHVGVTLLARAPEVYDLYVYRSLALDFAAWMREACAEHGVAIAPAEPGCIALA
ncbi:sarcosine oxidase subunit gamma family protein [Marinibaculum pumilum]|uniref:Sarcosine oxidase subunit gamma family protein n=1 Tax=Marinibaculum pumilum TaxID=1766165 RepID=A0ABV7L248_9PROT